MKLHKNIRNTSPTLAGFTLIELLVVIAIIGILASIVLSSLNTARTRASDAKIQGQLSSMRAQAELWTPVDPLVLDVADRLTETIITPNVNPITGVTLFSDDLATGSLTNLIGGLPVGTVVYYSYDAIPPKDGGMWVLAATTSIGASCVDWSGATGTFEGLAPVDAGEFEAAFVNIASDSPSPFSCL